MKTGRYHIIFDLSGCDKNIERPRKIKEFIRECAKACGMKILKGPIIAKGQKSDPGWSAFAIIDFSHISVHTFTKYDEALIDVYSCRPFNKKVVRALCQKSFAAAKSKFREKLVWWG